MSIEQMIHTNEMQAVGNVEVGAAFWFSETGGPIHSALILRTGNARIQTSATAADMRSVALMLVSMAEKLEVATSGRAAQVPS